MNIIENSLSVSLVSLLLFLLLGCEGKMEIYYYAYYTEYDSQSTAYMIKEVKTGIVRKETNSLYTLNGDFLGKDGDTFKIIDNGLEKLIDEADRERDEYKPFLSISDTTCITFKYNNETLNNIMETTYCFVGKENIILNNKKYSNAYKFIKKHGFSISEVYLDKDFVLIKDELIEGIYYYKIERIDEVLDFGNK